MKGNPNPHPPAPSPELGRGGVLEVDSLFSPLPISGEGLGVRVEGF